jgi:iron complex outermembrane recepter protein
MKLTYLFIATTFLFSQSFSQTFIKGQVTDNHKEPMAGVSIIVKNTEFGTISDPNGYFELSLPDDQKTLVFSYLGFQTQEYNLEKGFIYISMTPADKTLKEALVRGFSGVVGKARRRAESVQNIPESVVTFTSEQISAAGIHNVESFVSFVPNVSYNSSESVGINFLNVRGISQIRNGDSPVAFVIDGVTVPDPNLINQELYDLAMIEVVKGPQGALYGKNAIGGAINVVSMAPSNVSKQKLYLGYGNGNSFKAQLASSGAITKNKIFYRISGSYNHTDGFIENVFLKDKIDFLNDISLRGQLKFDFTTNLSATIVAQYSNKKGGAVNWAHSPTGIQLDPDDFNSIINSNVRGSSRLRSGFESLKIEYGKGNLKFQAITSYNDSRRFHEGDLDFTEKDILRQDQLSATKAFNQELRLSNHSKKRFKWDAGMFYQHSAKDLVTKAYADFGYFSPPYQPTGTLVLTNFQESRPLSDFTNIYNTLAAFGFSDYKLNDKFTFSIGLRLDLDRIHQQNRNDTTNPHRTDFEIQPKASLAYNITKNILSYFNYGRGYRNAGYNAETTALFNSQYEAETTNNFELGLKTSSADQRFIFNTSAFYIDFNNQQQYGVGFGTKGALLGNYNYIKSKVIGIEADLKYRTSRYLDILFSYGLNKSKIIDGGKSGTTDRTVFNHNYAPFTPLSSISTGLQSNFAINEKVNFTGIINMHYKGKIY